MQRAHTAPSLSPSFGLFPSLPSFVSVSRDPNGATGGCDGPDMPRCTARRVAARLEPREACRGWPTAHDEGVATGNHVSTLVVSQSVVVCLVGRAGTVRPNHAPLLCFLSLSLYLSLSRSFSIPPRPSRSADSSFGRPFPAVLDAFSASHHAGIPPPGARRAGRPRSYARARVLGARTRKCKCVTFFPSPSQTFSTRVMPPCDPLLVAALCAS